MPREGSKWYKPLYQCGQNRVHMFQSKSNKRHLHLYRYLLKTGEQIHLPREQRLIIENDINTRQTKAWSALDRLSVIWISGLSDKVKRNFFQAEVVSILLYGCTTWILTKCMEKKLDSNCTIILRAIVNKFWKHHPTKQQLFGHLPPTSKTIQIRRTRHAGHCWRSKGDIISDVLLWTPSHRRAGVAG